MTSFLFILAALVAAFFGAVCVCCAADWADVDARFAWVLGVGAFGLVAWSIWLFLQNELMQKLEGMDEQYQKALTQGDDLDTWIAEQTHDMTEDVLGRVMRIGRHVEALCKAWDVPIETEAQSNERMEQAMLRACGIKPEEGGEQK